MAGRGAGRYEYHCWITVRNNHFSNILMLASEQYTELRFTVNVHRKLTGSVRRFE